MYDFLEKAKLYLKLQEELGILASGYIQVTTGKIKALSEFFSTKVRLEYNDDLEFKYFYHLCIDGVKFVAVSDWQELRNYGFIETDFMEGAEVWG